MWKYRAPDRVIGFCIVFAMVIVDVLRLIRQARIRYRWADRPNRRLPWWRKF
jgi:hypothetical protein